MKTKAILQKLIEKVYRRLCIISPEVTELVEAIAHRGCFKHTQQQRLQAYQMIEALRKAGALITLEKSGAKLEVTERASDVRYIKITMPLHLFIDLKLPKPYKPKPKAIAFSSSKYGTTIPSGIGSDD